MAVFGFMLFVLGIIFVIVAPINKKKNARCSAQVQGILEKVYKKGGSKGGGHTYYYSYNVDGIEYQIKSTIRSAEADKVGDKCTIWYDPAKPKAAQPFHYETNKAYTVILIIGIVLILLGLFLMMFGLVRKSI